MTPELSTAPHIQPAAKSGKPLVLAVESDPSFAVSLKPLLEKSGYQVSMLDTPGDLIAQAKSRQPFLILMNTSLEGANAFELCRELKSSPYTRSIPVILLSTEQTDESFQLQGFSEGADDFLVKPVSEDLFEARLRAVLQRYSYLAEDPGSLHADGLMLDLRSRKLLVDDKPVAVTRKEFDLLATFLRKRGQLVYTTYLYHSVWGYGESVPVDSHTVKVHVSSLRNKLGPDLGKKIVNLPGLGYRFDQ